MSQYKVGVPIRIRYAAIDFESGISDLEAIVTKPDGTNMSPISLYEISDGAGYPTTGIYENSFVPDIVGWYWIRIRSVSKPNNKHSRSYFVGTEYTSYPVQEDGNVQDIKDGLLSVITEKGSDTSGHIINIGGETSDGKTNSIYVDDIGGHNRLHTISLPEVFHETYEERLFQANAEITIQTQNETDIALVRVPTGIGKNIYLYKLLADVISKGSQCAFRLYAGSTVSNYGTPITINNRFIKANAQSSSIYVYTNPTISSRGTRSNTFSVGANTNTFINNFDFSIIVSPGVNLLLTGQPTSNNTIIAVTLVWAEI